MKILITGANSYIGTSVEKYLLSSYAQTQESVTFANSQQPAANGNEHSSLDCEQGGYSVDTLDMLNPAWCATSFSDYDAVFHVAGIVHIKETEENEHLYYEVNRDLAVEVAKKAKTEGVKQFIFLSSMSVYGLDSGIITKDTVPQPVSNYGKSKLQAEQELEKLADGNFKVAIIRPPMVYGKGCKGNFQMLVKIVEKLPVFPRVSNKRSMIYIENLAEFVKTVIDRELHGTFMAQNREYVNTSEMAKLIATQLGKKLYQSYLLGFVVNILKHFIPKVNKAFGSLIYQDTEEFGFCYCKTEFEESVRGSI